MIGSQDERERRLAALYQKYVDRLIAGEPLAAEEILEREGDLGPELLEHLEAFQAAGTESGLDPLGRTEAIGVLGDYEIQRECGRGGMGVVYEAWQNSLERRVALKILPPGVAADPKRYQRFVREAQVAAKLNHPNVVTVYGLGIEENTPYYAMAFIDGETLAEVIARLKDAPLDAATPFGAPCASPAYAYHVAGAFVGVADALQEAHSQGVIHRDIKPSNLILDCEAGQEGGRRVRLRILDFGLALLEGEESLSATGDVVGTPLYMSPEQARRRKIAVDHRTDVYSLGATLYEALTLRPPFRGRDCQETLSQILTRDPQPPRRLNPRIPRDLETIVLKCLRKDPADRYLTAEALAQDLRRFTRGDPVEARPEARWERVLRRARRQRWKLLVAAVGAILVAACGLLLRQLSIEKERSREYRARQYERTVVVQAMKLLRAEWALSPGRGAGGTLPRLVLLPRDDREPLTASGRAAVGEAAAELAGAVEAFPERFEGHYHLARALGLLKRREEALVRCEEALRIRPDFVPARVLCSELLGERDPAAPSSATSGWGAVWARARRAMRVEEWKEAAAAYSDLIAREARDELYLGSSVEHLLGRGRALLEAGDLEGAKLDFQAARVLGRTLWGEFLEPVLLLGKAYFLAGDPERAERLFSEAAALAGGGERGALWVAGAYASLTRRLTHGPVYGGRIEEAARAARKAAEHHGPRDARTWIALGRALLHVVWARGEWGRLDREAAEARELEEVSRRALGLEPGNPAAHAFLSQVLEAEGDRARAREAARRARELASHQKGDTDMKAPKKAGAAAVAAAVALGLGAGAGTQEGHFEVEGRLEGCVHSTFTEFHVALARDGSRLFFGAIRPGGAGSLDLYTAVWDEAAGAFADCRNLSELNSSRWDGGASLSADGRTLYFHSTRLQPPQSDTRDLFQATWDPDAGSFSDIRPLDGINTGFNDSGHPCISTDGLELFFHSTDRPGGRGGRDLWVAWRESTGEEFTAEKVRPLNEINSEFDEFMPWISRDGKALFWTGLGTSNSHDGLGVPSSIWMALRPATRDPVTGEPLPFEGVRKVPLVPEVPAMSVTVSDAWPEPGAKVYFNSCLPGECEQAEPDIDIYVAAWHPEPEPEVTGPFLRGDCDGDGRLPGAVNDAVANFQHCFRGREVPCRAACDADADGNPCTGVTDGILILNYLFRGGRPLPAPFPDCGTSEGLSDAELGCERSGCSP